MNPRGQKEFRTKPVRRPGTPASVCTSWALLLPDAAEGLLSEAEQRALDQHLAGCAACTEELAEAQRGLAWLTVLKEQTPELPQALLAHILAQTTGVAEAGVSLPPLVSVPVHIAAAPMSTQSSGAWEKPGQQPAAGSRDWRGLEGLWSSLVQPRLAMTGAMAFFSICLTLNLLGVSVSNLQAQTLRQGGLHRTVAHTGASLVRSLEGLRLVYRVESRVNEMRAQMDDADASPAKH